MKRSRIDLLAPPFCGHLHPVLGIARALRDSHTVRVLSTVEALPDIEAAGIQGLAVLDDSDGALRQIVSPSHAVRSNPARLHRQFQFTLGFLQQLRQSLRALYVEERPDLLIADFTLPVSGVVAAELGIPWWTVLESPCVMETADGPPAYLGGLRPCASPYSRARNFLGRKLVRSFKRATFSIYRRQIAAAGVDRLYRKDGSEEVYSAERVLAIGVRELEFERSWLPSVHFIGPVLYTPPSSVPDPEFRSNGKHVLITLGTHLPWIKDQVAAAVERAARSMLNVTFHFTDGKPAGSIIQRGNFSRFPYVNYDLHLHRYDLVVHHGGSGVMYHCLKHGTPAVVYPVDYDQFDHAVRLESAGVARRLHDLRTFKCEVENALHSADLAERCREFAGVVNNYHPEQAIRRLVNERLERLRSA